jgi:hypothetical protein
VRVVDDEQTTVRHEVAVRDSMRVLVLRAELARAKGPLAV